MTDRERLLEILNKPIFPHELVDPLEAVADYLLDNGVTFQKWIPVTERVPDEPGYVLAMWKYINEDKLYCDRLNYDGELFPWENFCFKEKHKVTHWMPLPEPPEEE